MKRIILNVIVLVFLFSGCAHLPLETGKRFLGVSTQDLENARSTGVFWVYYGEIDDCFDAALKAVKDIGGVVYMRNKRKKMIVGMDFKYERRLVDEEDTLIKPLDEIIDTTEVGIFFEAMENNKTKVELSSLSSSLLEDIARRFFKSLEENLNEGKAKE
ncbi:MAG: hypothetical protein P9L96_01080 [Candidatus Gygaella obscura]|nr:hypothetical protein [Candidatus Gygaella obscura]